MCKSGKVTVYSIGRRFDDRSWFRIGRRELFVSHGVEPVDVDVGGPALEPVDVDYEGARF